MGDFLARNWGSLASVVGLIFSFLAYVFSRRASKAAKEARDLVLSQSLGEDMNQGNRTASEIVTYVSMERGDVALLRAGELQNRTSHILARWSAKLSEQSKNNLLAMREQLRAITEVLTKTPLNTLGAHDKARLAQTCQRVNATYSEEYGAAVRAADRQV
ncbi:MAG: hypothetical protein AAB225_14685 [Acidobacteriota bacterium]